jgi:hypothetical protein
VPVHDVLKEYRRYILKSVRNAYFGIGEKCEPDSIASFASVLKKGASDTPSIGSRLDSKSIPNFLVKKTSYILNTRSRRKRVIGLTIILTLFPVRIHLVSADGWGRVVSTSKLGLKTKSYSQSGIESFPKSISLVILQDICFLRPVKLNYTF